mmetsp:Transcript_115684/g.289100  ORF Transcript_115684/g.289100 Transcript_115684/m.289100 type:complete len:223 (-) Transcript_115684:404-1072(-)
MQAAQQRSSRLHKRRQASASARLAFGLLAAAGALALAGAPLGFSAGTGGPHGQRQRPTPRRPLPQGQQQQPLQQQQPQQPQQEQQRQDLEQPSAFADLRGVGVPAETSVSDEQLAAVWRLPEQRGSSAESDPEQPAKHAFWARQKVTPRRDQAMDRSALRLPTLHKQVKRALQFHEDRLAREKAAKEEFDPDNADHVATLLYRIFTFFVLWTGAMGAMGPNL